MLEQGHVSHLRASHALYIQEVVVKPPREENFGFHVPCVDEKGGEPGDSPPSAPRCDGVAYLDFRACSISSWKPSRLLF